MRQSHLFTKISRNAPKDEKAINAQLLERGGFIHKNSAGVYSYLPLGWLVIQKIAGIIRAEMNAIGGQEMFMPALVEKKYLEATGRFDAPVGYKVVTSNQQPATSNQFVLGWTHEEMITAIAAHHVSSYKDLPLAAYQIQTKFRNEPRAKSGLLRGREFMMKDLYSFHESEESFRRYYEKIAQSYHAIFRQCGLEAIYTLAAGGDFTLEHTHEFQVPCDAGEDTIFVCRKCGYAENKEISKLSAGATCAQCTGKIEEKKTIEVGNIFPLGTKYSEALGLSFSDGAGKKKHVVMGSYGIGLGRLMGTVVELHHDTDGIIWPRALAPFSVHLLALNGADGTQLYKALQEKGVEVLYDDRDASAGEKFAESDLLGIPWRMVVSPKLEEGKAELKNRGGEKASVISADPAQIIKAISQK